MRIIFICIATVTFTLFVSCSGGIERFNDDKTKTIGVDFDPRPGGESVNYKIAKSQNVRFVIIKKSGSKDYNQRNFIFEYSKIKDEKLIRGSYHYWYNNIPWEEQADSYIKNLEILDDDLPPILDLEDSNLTKDNTDVGKGIMNWIEKIEKKFNRSVIIYAGPVGMWNEFLTKANLADTNKNKLFWLVIKSKVLWICDPNNTEPELLKFQSKKVWNNYLFWQYEIDTKTDFSNKVDIDVFNGNEKEFIEFIGASGSAKNFV